MTFWKVNLTTEGQCHKRKRNHSLRCWGWQDTHRLMGLLGHSRWPAMPPGGFESRILQQAKKNSFEQTHHDSSGKINRFLSLVVA